MNDISEKMMRDAIPVFVDVLWAVSVRDMEATLRNICRRVARDISGGAREKQKKKKQDNTGGLAGVVADPNVCEPRYVHVFCG